MVFLVRGNYSGAKNIVQWQKILDEHGFLMNGEYGRLTSTANHMVQLS
jgi:hypothetical protein